MAENYEDRAHKQLQIESWSNSARTLLIRGSTPGGPLAEQHVTNADRSRATDTFEFHGVPTKLQVSPLAGPVRRGECYVRMTLLLDGEPALRLSAGYLTDSKTMSWPPGVFEGFTEGPGLIRAFSGTDPAAGIEISEVVPTNARWKLRSIRFWLVTDATVANRYVILTIDDGATVFFEKMFPAQAASLTQAHMAALGLGESEAAWDSGARCRVALPDMLLFQGWRIRTVTTNLVAGDNLGSPHLQIEEWIEE